MTSPVAQLRSITKSYPGVVALDDVDLELMPAEVLGLAGENGAGKSTLIKVLSGAVEPDSGELWLSGEPVRLRTPREAIARGISVVHQELAGAPHLSVTENVLLGRLPHRLGRVDWTAAHRRTREVLDQLGVDISGRAVMGDLSLGRQQLVEIARALVRDARILILDEPSAILGSRDLDVLFDTIRSLRERGVSCIYISHRLEELFTLADRVSVLRDGAHVGTHRTEDLDEERLITLMTGRQIGAVDRRQRPRAGSPVLAVDGLTRSGAFQDVSFAVHAGEVVGMAGLVGAGRTEVARVVAGVDDADAGTVTVRGRQLRLGHPASARRFGIGLLPENRKDQGLLMNRSVRENVGLASLRKRSRGGVISGASDLRQVRDVANRVDLRYTGPAQLAGNLSGGNQQKVLLARWLAAGVAVLLLDEPTRGVDVGGKSEIYALIREVADQGVAILMISSEVEEVVSMSDRVLVMREGRLVARLAAEESTEERIMRSALVRSVDEATPDEAVRQ
jgi:ribose transport system ATP-binding protein